MKTLIKILVFGLVIGGSSAFASISQVQVCKIKVTKASMMDAIKEVDFILSHDSGSPTETDQKNCAIFAHSQALFAKDQVNAKVEVTFNNVETRNYMLVE